MSFISISERAYKYIRQFTIKSVNDALIELITNCVDAYRKTSVDVREIDIDIYDNTKIIVTDRAIGLTSEELKKCFLQVGTYTADDTSRGFFSRGAKDISALGDVTFIAIKNGKYSKCILDTDAYGEMLVSDEDVTDDIRELLKIPVNGLSVMLELLPNFQSINIDNTYEGICKLACLRDINSDPKNIIMMRRYDVNINKNFEKRVQYSYPASTLILDLEYVIPNYPDERARLVVYKTDKPIPQPVEEQMLEFGFIIKDDKTVFEVNTIDPKFRWNPYINYIYGYIYTTSISNFLIDYDISGTTNNNPYPIIDPSRITGVNKMHPLIQNLYALPLVRIDAILRELNNSISSKSVTIEDINDLLDELGKYGLDIIKKNDVPINFLPSYDSNLFKAIQDDRENYVICEKSHNTSGNYSTDELYTDNYIKEQLNQISSVSESYYYVNSDNELVSINLFADQNNLPANLLDLIPEADQEQLKVNPYIYKLTDTGKLEKLYIFQRGVIDTVNPATNPLLIQSRQFTIQFINDLNLDVRYIIDNTNGVIIKLNLNNPMVAKYLTNKNIDSLDDLITMSSITSLTSLIFMESLITDILADLVLQSDVSNGKLILDSSSYDNSQKILDYRNKLITKIEIPVNTIFSKYVYSAINENMKQVSEKIDLISGSIIEQVTNPETADVSQLGVYSEQFKNLVKSLMI